MSTERENFKSSRKLAQYYQNHSCFSGQAQRIFAKDYEVKYQIAETKYLESENPELIGFTALHMVSKYTNKADIEYFLSLGADPMIKSKKNLTPLHLAIPEQCERVEHFYERKPSCAALLSAQVKLENLENPRNEINGLTHFHIACMADHAEAIEMFLKSGLSVDETIDMNSPHFAGYTPLHFAAKFSALRAFQVLLNHGANTQAKDAKGMTFLHTLVEARTEIIQPTSDYDSNFGDPHLEVIMFLLQNDSYVIDFAGLPKLHLACSIPDSLTAESLLRRTTDINHGLDMNAPIRPGYTALHFAANSSLEVVKMLVKNEANISAKDAKGTTPLNMCVEKYGPTDVHAILSLDANFRSILMSDRKTRMLSILLAMKDSHQFNNFLESRLQIVNTFVPHDSPAWQGFTLLHIAVMFYKNHMIVSGREDRKDERSEHIIKKLITLGASINARDIHGRSPLNLTFRQRIKKNPEGQEQKIRKATKLLLEFSDKIDDVVDEENLSHLHIACRMHDKASVEKILQTTVDVNVAYRGQSNVAGISAGMTPLHCAATNDDIVALLLRRGADPLLKDAKGTTAIHHSSGQSKAILSSPNLKECVVEESGLSHLHIAAYCGEVNAVNKLLDEGADMKRVLLRDSVFFAKDKFAGYSPFDIAVEQGKTEVMDLLLRRSVEFLIEKPAKMNSNESHKLKQLVESLSRDDSLFKRLEKEIGLTMLHVACSKRDLDLMWELIAGGANVNARINVKSRLWPGFAPLHVVVAHENHLNNLDETVRLLLDNGADVTLMRSTDGETALHMIYDWSYEKTNNTVPKTNRCMKLMLRAHKDFSVNPTRSDGLSHFFVACGIGDVVSVKKFLQHGCADVNRPLAYFKTSSRDTNGYTPLLVVAGLNCEEDPIAQLELVDLLLNHGADVETEDLRYATTPLSLMAMRSCKREGVIMRMIRSKANVSHRDILDHTPLELVLSTRGITIDIINCFLKLGCPFNVFNSETDKGLIAIALTLVSDEEQLYFIKSTMINFPHLLQTDDMDRTVIHNIVSNRIVLVEKQLNYARYTQEPAILDNQYTILIKEIENFGLNVNDQDSLGRTALHLATLFRNTQAICGLLMAGADINVTDSSGKTAFYYVFQSCIRCAEMETSYQKAYHNNKQYQHFDIFSIFVIHMKKLLCCGLDVNEANQNLMFEAFEQFKSKDMTLPTTYEDQIDEIKNLKIAESKLTFGKFLSETDAVVAYSTLQKSDSYMIDEFFKDRYSDFLIKYSQVAGILFLQYRKAVKRIVLNKSAHSALKVLTGLPMPDLCSAAILKLLTNSELGSMIKAAT